MYTNEGHQISERELERIERRLYTPAQSVEEVMQRGNQPEPITPGQLSEAHHKILYPVENLSADRREWNYLMDSGQIAKAFASTSDAYIETLVADLRKSLGLPPLASASALHKCADGCTSDVAAGICVCSTCFAKRKRVPFSKVDEAKREVWGIVTEQKPDKDGEVCDFAQSLPHYQNWVNEFSKATDGASLGNLREMHQLSAVGKAISFDPRPQDRQIWMGFKIVDDAAWEKVLARVYTGFSHGGEKVGGMTDDPEFPGCKRYVAKPSEVSLVDNPCLGTAHYSLVRADGKTELVKINAAIEVKSTLAEIKARLAKLAA